jgi:hypothetical protein
MSKASAGFERMLRQALDEAIAHAPQARDDLFRIASEAGAAVKKVTDGAATLELVPVDVGKDSRPTYQLQLVTLDGESSRSDLGVFRLSATGYPVQRWASKHTWMKNPEKPEREHNNNQDLSGNFEYMLSTPTSKLVVIINSLRAMKGIK